MLPTEITLLLLYSVHFTQSLSCFKCMTTNFLDDKCGDPFHPIDHQLETECQATIKDQHGLFPARFCVKISGIIVDIDVSLNRTLIQKNLYLRTCVTENIMDSTRLLDSTGNFRLKHYGLIAGEIKMQGTITLCTIDGCNHADCLARKTWPILFLFLVLILV